MRSPSLTAGPVVDSNQIGEDEGEKDEFHDDRVNARKKASDPDNTSAQGRRLGTCEGFDISSLNVFQLKGALESCWGANTSGPVQPTAAETKRQP